MQKIRLITAVFGNTGLTSLALSGLLLAAGTQLGATPTYFYNDPATARAAFHAATSGSLQLESFESLFTAGSPVSFPVGGPQAFTVSASINAALYGRSAFSRGVTDGLYAMAVDEDYSSLTVWFTFDRPINAFGLDVNDLNFANMSYTDNLGNVRTDALLGDNGGPAGGPSYQNLQFFGVVNSAPFSLVGLAFENPSTFTGTIFLDALEFAPVPEPGTLALFSAGLALLLSLHWRARCKRS